jgi:hypothetical protein
MNKDYPIAFRERMEKIVANDEKLSNRWELKFPDWVEFDFHEEE